MKSSLQGCYYIYSYLSPQPMYLSGLCFPPTTSATIQSWSHFLTHLPSMPPRSYCNMLALSVSFTSVNLISIATLLVQKHISTCLDYCELPNSFLCSSHNCQSYFPTTKLCLYFSLALSSSTILNFTTWKINLKLFSHEFQDSCNHMLVDHILQTNFPAWFHLLNHLHTSANYPVIHWALITSCRFLRYEFHFHCASTWNCLSFLSTKTCNRRH